MCYGWGSCACPDIAKEETQWDLLLMIVMVMSHICTGVGVEIAERENHGGVIWNIIPLLDAGVVHGDLVDGVGYLWEKDDGDDECDIVLLFCWW